MSEGEMPTERKNAPSANPGMESVSAIVNDAMGAQERMLRLSQSWSEGILQTLKDQAESTTTLLRSIDASMRAMERALASQAESNRALAESLEASQSIVRSAVTAQEHTLEQVESYFGGMLSVLTGQLQALRTQVETSRALLSGPASSQSSLFLQMTQEWMEAYRRLLGAAPAPFGPAGGA
jgi:predicted transcriptional regulator